MAVIDGLETVPLDGRLGSATMEGSSNAAGVTAEGVRAGDRAALQALVDRRGPAVVAFCTQVCGPSAAPRAAAEAFARFRAAVRDAADAADDRDPESLLRGATRHAAASMARTPIGPPPHGRLRSRGTETCAQVPTMLAARANGALGERDVERLARHLDRCERCEALGEIFHRAELAYQDPPFDTLGTETSSVLLDALGSVSVHALGTAPAPGPDTPTAEPLDGAFGHLPDLDDEVPLAPEPTVAPEPEAAAPVLDPEEVEAPAGDHEEHDADEDDSEDEHDEREHDAEAVMHDVDGEWTLEFDALEEEVEGEPGDRDDHELAPVAGALTVRDAPRRRRGTLRRVLRVGVPAILVAAAIAVGFAVSGGGDEPTPVTDAPPAVKVQRPVITPLPLTVAAEEEPDAATTPDAAGTTP